jgi:hypothetical protein
MQTANSAKGLICTQQLLTLGGLALRLHTMPTFNVLLDSKLHP